MKILRDQTFWLGAMSAFAIVFFALFVGMAMDKVSFNGGGGKRVVTPPSNYGEPSAPAVAPGLSAQDQAVAIAEGADIDVKKFETCLDEGRYKAMIQEEITKAGAAGAQGTPYSVAIKGDKMVVINGAQPKASIDAILNDFDSATPAPETVVVAPITDADHIRGAENAQITIVEYSDIDCPFCKRFHTTMQQIVGERDDVQWVYRHLPLAQLHPDAPFKAEASECAGDVGGDEKFWTFLDRIIEA